MDDGRAPRGGGPRFAGVDDRGGFVRNKVCNGDCGSKAVLGGALASGRRLRYKDHRYVVFACTVVYYVIEIIFGQLDGFSLILGAGRRLNTARQTRRIRFERKISIAGRSNFGKNWHRATLLLGTF